MAGQLAPVFKSTMINEKQVSMGAALCSHYYSVLTALHRNLLPVKHGQPLAPLSSAKAVSALAIVVVLAEWARPTFSEAPLFCATTSPLTGLTMGDEVTDSEGRCARALGQ